MIITITLNAALDRTQRIEHPLQVGKLNRAVSSHLEPGGKGKLAAAPIPVVLDPENEKSKKDEQNREPNDE